MAHNITERDDLFTVREPAWHGLGQVLPEHPTREEAQAIAHPWEPVAEPLYRKEPVITEHWHSVRCPEDCEQVDDVYENFEKVEGWNLNVRSDIATPLGVTSDTYELVGNNEMYDIAEALEGESDGSVKYETAGSLKGGSKVWLLVRLDEPLRLNDDPLTATIPYYSLQNSHDGSGSFRGQATMTRIVCDNTAQMADMDAKMRGTEFTFRHSKNVQGRIDDARAALSGWRESIDAWQLQSEHLLNRKVLDLGTRDFITSFIPEPKGGLVSDRVLHNVDMARNELQSILDGVTCEPIAHTAYGLVQASLEYWQHGRRANSDETLFKRAYLDKSKLTAKAVELALRVSA